MLRRGLLLICLVLLSCPVFAQPGPGLFGDRRWRAPVANAGALPASGSMGEIRLTLNDGALYFWDGDSWEAAGSGGGSGEANTASNLGGGLGLFSAKVGVDLQFNSLAGADFDLGSNLITIDDTKWAKDSEIPAGDAPHSRTVTVDAAGLGDYSTIKAACDFVATQTRSAGTQWLILVHNGLTTPAIGYDDWYNYDEQPFTVPSWTTVQGVSTIHNTPTLSGVGGPLVRFTAASGALVTLGEGASLSNLQIYYYGTPAAPGVVGITTPFSGINVVENVSIQFNALGTAASLTGYQSTGDAGLYLYDSSAWLSAGGAVGSTLLLSTSSNGVAVYGGRWGSNVSCSALISATAGKIRLFWTRVDDFSCTVDLSASGTGQIYAVGTPYRTAGGTIIHPDGSQGIQFCKTYSGTGSPEGTLSAPVCSSYWQRDGAAGAMLYLKHSGSGNTGWVAVDSAADDDVPEAGDFGALALTGSVTSSGLATAIAADAVALGSQTTGAYVAGATGSQGLALAGSEAGTLGLMDCAASEIPKRNAGDTAWECAADATGGGGGIGGSTGATDNAVLVADGAGGATLKASAVTITAGAVRIPDGSAAAVGLRFASMAAGTGLRGSGATTLTFTQNGTDRWNISNSAIYSQSGAHFYNQGVGNPVFMPGSTDLDSGLGANAADDMAMFAGSGQVERWLRVTGGVWRSLNVGQTADSPQAVTCTDSGDGSPGALTINPTAGAVYITNSDANGCAVTLGETNVTSGQRVEFVVVSSAGGTVDYADTAGVTELAGAFNAGLYDSLALRYISDRWIETGRSDN